MIKNIGIIFNPHAKRGKNYDRKNIFRELLAGVGSLWITDGTPDLDQAIYDFDQQGIELIGICGGDGTIQAALTRIIEYYSINNKEIPLIITLGGGTVNSFAKDLGIILPPEMILKQVIDYLKYGVDLPFTERVLLKVNNRYGFIFGSVMVHNIIRKYHEGKIRGILKTSYISVKLILSILAGTAFAEEIFCPEKAKIFIDGKEELPADYFTAIFASSIKSTGLWLKVVADEADTEQRFMLITSKIKGRVLLKALPDVILGKPFVQEGVFYRNAKEVAIKPAEILYYIIDGEPFIAKNEIKITLGPALKFVCFKR